MMAAKRLCPRLLVLLFAAFMLNACMFDDDDNNSSAAPLTTGLQTLQSGDDEREFYSQLPADYAADASAAAIGDDPRKPLLFLYHGYTGSYENWIGDDP